MQWVSRRLRRFKLNCDWLSAGHFKSNECYWLIRRLPRVRFSLSSMLPTIFFQIKSYSKSNFCFSEIILKKINFNFRWLILKSPEKEARTVSLLNQENGTEKCWNRWPFHPSVSILWVWESGLTGWTVESMNPWFGQTIFLFSDLALLIQARWCTTSCDIVVWFSWCW